VPKPVNRKVEPGPKPVDEAGAQPFGLDRLIFFSDAVMAIAITLLILDIKLPAADITALTDAQITAQVLALWPKYMGYVVSFWVIALYWVAHLRCFRYIRAYDRRLIYLNFLFLLFIAFMPFPTGLLFSTHAITATVVLYSCTAAGMGLSLAAVWSYAVAHRYTRPDVPPILVRDIRISLLLPSLVFVASAVIAFFDAGVAMFAWFALIPVYLVRRVREEKLMGRVTR
jgi:uncharacterized membrane protein